MVMQEVIVDDAAIEALRGGGFRGELLRPSDDEYDSARRVFNGMIDRRPSLIARCSGTADVIAAVRFARERDLLAAVRGGGHGVAGFAVCDGGIVIDTSHMRGVRVDTDARTARAAAGVTWGEFDHETQAFGLATTGGLISTTGIAGLTLGGGIGLLLTKHGLSCDNLIGADVVTASGELVKATEKQNAELLWGLRGGGGNFGVVTSFEYRLHPVGLVPLTLVIHPADAAPDVLRFYRDFIESAPDETPAFAILLTVPEQPPMPIFPQEILGKRAIALIGAYIGPVEEGERALKPLGEFGNPAMNLVLPLPYTMVQSMQDEDAPWGTRNYWKSLHLKQLSDEAIDAIVFDGSNAPSPRTQVTIGKLGGAMARVGENDTAFPLRDAGYLCQLDSIWDNAGDDDANIAWTRSLYDKVEPYAIDRVYVNFIGDEGEARIPRAYGPEKYARLAKLKAQYDPTNFFRLNQNIQPAS
jgi:FAD/FMN-containing dehydrogenase